MPDRPVDYGLLNRCRIELTLAADRCGREAYWDGRCAEAFEAAERAIFQAQVAASCFGLDDAAHAHMRSYSTELADARRRGAA